MPTLVTICAKVFGTVARRDSDVPTFVGGLTCSGHERPLLSELNMTIRVAHVYFLDYYLQPCSKLCGHIAIAYKTPRSRDSRRHSVKVPTASKTLTSTTSNNR